METSTDNVVELSDEKAEPKQPIIQDISLDPSQAQAIELCLNVKNKLVSVSGKAGVGKTTILRTVHKELTNAGYRVICTAPTGKAARRITEATGLQAVTNHKLLEYPRPGDRDEDGKPLQVGLPRRHRGNPIDYDCILCDEYAMTNQEIHRNLIDALPNRGFMRCFGDVYQLPPIERHEKWRNSPSPFMTLLLKFPSMFLTENHRQGEDSGVYENCERILKGYTPLVKNDFSIAVTEQPQNALLKAIELFQGRGISFEGLTTQIITPAVKTWVGTLALNSMLQGTFRDELGLWLDDIPRHKWVKQKGSFRLAEGDKILWTENDYHLEVMNGEVGIVKDISIAEDTFVINFGDREVVIPPVIEYIDQNGTTRTYDPRKSVDLGYAVTTHKTQGSEYQQGIYVLNRSSRYNQNRNNFYTAAARNKKHAHIVTDSTSMNASVSTVNPVIRQWISDMRSKGIDV